MRRFIFLLLFGIFSLSLFSAEVSLERARTVAHNFLQNMPNNKLKSTSIDELVYAGDIFQARNTHNKLKSTQLSSSSMYVFNVSTGSGFVIVAGDDAAVPILAYSTEQTIDVNHIPKTVYKWLDTYQKQILYIQQKGLGQTEEIRSLWDGSAIQFKSSQSVAPLVETQWNQAPYVNDKCPYDEDYNERVVTGCPATAMAQIMRYWKYPEKGSGFHAYQHNKYGTLSANFGSTKYDWDAMPKVINSANDAVATLMYHCGVAVEMSYNVSAEGGSGSYVIKDSWGRYSDAKTVENALSVYFGYDESLRGIERSSYSDREWKNLLKAELDAKRPIQYAGYGQGGHTFVCDGYDQNEYFHMNWGWGGVYDGYYFLDNLSPGIEGIGAGSGSFNNGQQALIGIQPRSTSDDFALEVYKDVSVNKSTISYGEGFVISTDILNDGSGTFTGDFCAGIFDDDDVFIDFVQIHYDWDLQANYHYTDGVTFETEGLLELLPGNYTVYVFYRPDGGNWEMLSPGSLDFFTDYYAQIEVVNDNDLQLYAPMNVSNTNIYRNDSLSVWLDVANFYDDDFMGIFDVSLYNLEGDFVSTIEEKYGIILDSRAHYANGLTFSTDNVDVEPGTYLLALLHKSDGGSYELTGSTSEYTNPIKVIVQETPYALDPYENNDSIEMAYKLRAHFSNNTANISTTGANAHVGSDWDFYSIPLDDGYNYTIDLRLYDAYSNDTDEDYTLDALFLYSLDGKTWSDSYDDVMTSPIITSGNKTLYCVVSPYFLGEKGTYLLDVNMTRSENTAVQNTKQAGLNVFPNPCLDELVIDGVWQQGMVRMYDARGVLLSTNVLNDQARILDVSTLAKGVYVLEIEMDDQIVVTKIVKE